MGVGPGQSLSCPHSAHRGSRDLEVLEVLLGRQVFVVAHCGSKDTDS